MTKEVLPNFLTALRFLLTLVIVVLMHFKNQINFEIACWAVVAAGATDILDGIFARRYRVESKVGKFLDPLADKILVISTLIMLVWLGRIAPILVILVIGREVIITGVRAMAATGGLVIAAGTQGKIKTTLQMVGIGALILDGNYFGLDAHIVGTVCIWASLYFSLVSGWEYTREYLKLR